MIIVSVFIQSTQILNKALQKPGYFQNILIYLKDRKNLFLVNLLIFTNLCMYIIYVILKELARLLVS